MEGGSGADYVDLRFCGHKGDQVQLVLVAFYVHGARSRAGGEPTAAAAAIALRRHAGVWVQV